MNLLKWVLTGSMTIMLLLASAVIQAKPQSEVVEVVTFKLKAGVTPAQFKPLDAAVEQQYVSKLPGFISRESMAGANGDWLMIVRWASEKDADASMATFAKAPLAKTFMSKIDESSMVLKRYAH